MKTERRIVATTIALLCLLNDAALAQKRTVLVAPGSQYQAGSLHQWMFGSGYRDLWQTPVRVPVLNLRTFAGGLTAVEDGGGKQTHTLHLRGRDGREYVFRSVNKNIDRVAPILQSTVVGKTLQDAVSMYHPSGAPMVPPLLKALGVLHVVPRLYLMPDDARLGEFRGRYAGMLGYLEEKPEEGANGTIGFARSKNIVGTEKLRAQIREDSRHRVDERDWLAARLVDFFIGDTDRGASQWRWAEYKAGDGFLWRPIPRDRDFAFIHADGFGPRIMNKVVKKLVIFNDRLPPLDNLTIRTIYDDRVYLQSLDAAEWNEITQRVHDALTDDVIDAAVRTMPAEHYKLRGRQIAGDLRARRSALTATARRFYARLAEQVDVQASDQNERADIRRLDDGSVEVRVYQVVDVLVATNGAGSNGHGNGDLHDGILHDEHAFYYRRFRPGETKEVRIYLHGGDDAALITGANGKDAIKVRVVGGAGNDALVDASTNGAGGTNTWLYDDAGSNDLRGGKHSAVDRRPFIEPHFLYTVIDKKRYRDWGATHGIAPLLDFRANTGFIVGVQYGQKEYGFRRTPFESQGIVKLMYAPGAGAFGAEIGGEHYFENSAWSVALTTRASGYDNLRFFGYGNNSPDVESDSALVEWQRVQATAALRYARGNTNFAFGAAAQVSDTEVEEGTPLALTQPLGVGDWTQYGLWTELGTAFAGRNARISAEAAYYPAAPTLDESYGTARGTAVFYIGSAPTLALRAIGEKIWGNAPFQDAAYIGGRRSLRGYASYRFAGDASLLGNAELRIPITSEAFGVFLLADAGRVYLDGASPGGWHTAYGGGLWLSALGRAVSASYANGEDHKFYVMLGMPF